MDPQALQMGSEFNPAIPHHITAYVGGRNDSKRHIYALYKDGKLLVIETFPTQDEIDWSDPGAAVSKLDKEHFSGLEKIQTLLNTIEFGRTNWAYLIEQPERSGGLRIALSYKERPIHEISCPLWAPLVEESEIIYTKWISCEERHGLWKGKKVDLFMGWDKSTMQRVEDEMKVQRAMLRLGVTFEVLGHVIRDGKVIGLMRQPAYGRMVEIGDRAAVYAAITQVQKSGFLCRSIHCSNIMMSRDKVRLWNIGNALYYPPHERHRLDVEAQRFHWEALERMFHELSFGRNFMTPYRSLSQNIKIIPSPTSPERPLTFSLTLYHIDLIFDGERKRRPSSSKHRGAKGSKERHSNYPLPVLPSSPLREECPDLQVVSTRDAPLDVNALRPFTRIRLHQSFHPYQRTPSKKPLLADDTACQSSSA